MVSRRSAVSSRKSNRGKKYLTRKRDLLATLFDRKFGKVKRGKKFNLKRYEEEVKYYKQLKKMNVEQLRKMVKK